MGAQVSETIRVEFCMSVSLTDIYDACSKNFAILKAERDKEMKKKMATHVVKRRNTEDDVENYGFTHKQKPYNILSTSKTTEKVISFRETEAIAQGKKKITGISFLTDLFKHYKVLSVGTPTKVQYIILKFELLFEMKYVYKTMFFIPAYF